METDNTLMLTILSIVGGFLVIAAGILAWLLKGIYDNMGKVDVGLATLIVKHDNVDARVTKVEIKIDEHEKKIQNIQHSVGNK